MCWLRSVEPCVVGCVPCLICLDCWLWPCFWSGDGFCPSFVQQRREPTFDDSGALYIQSKQNCPLCRVWLQTARMAAADLNTVNDFNKTSFCDIILLCVIDRTCEGCGGSKCESCLRACMWIAEFMNVCIQSRCAAGHVRLQAVGVSVCRSSCVCAACLWLLCILISFVMLLMVQELGGSCLESVCWLNSQPPSHLRAKVISMARVALASLLVCTLMA